MKAVAVNPKSRTAGVVEVPEPAPRSATDVVVRVLEVGVCGTDREIARFDYGTPPPGSDVLIIGHEALAEVERVGDAVEGIAPGDLVVPMVRRPCPDPACTPCRHGRADFCITGNYTERGINKRHGYMAERVVVDARWLVAVPAALRHIGVLTEPLTIAEKALTQIDELQRRLPPECRHTATPEGGGGARRHTALVIGAGPVGLLGAMALRVAGYRTVVYSRGAVDSPRAQLALAIGARYLPAEDHDPQSLAAEVGPIDVVYEAAGASQVAFEVLQELGPNGVFVFTGIPGRKGPFQVDTDRLMRSIVLGNQLVLGTVNADKASYARAVRDLAAFHAQFPDAVRGLVTDRLAPEKATEALTGSADAIKQIVVMAG